METTINQVKLANYLFSATPENIKSSNVENFPSSSSKRKLQNTDPLKAKVKRRYYKENHVNEDLPISSEMDELIKNILNDVDEDGVLKDDVGSHLSQPLNATSLFFPIASKIESTFTAEKRAYPALDTTVDSNKFTKDVKLISASNFVLTQASGLVNSDFEVEKVQMEKFSPTFSGLRPESSPLIHVPENSKNNSRVGINQLHHQLEIMYLRRKAKLEQQNGNLFVASRCIQKALNLLLGVNSDPLLNPTSSSSERNSKAFRDTEGYIDYEDVGLLQPTLSSSPFEILQTIHDDYFLFDPIVHSKAGKIQRFYRKYLGKRIYLANRLNNIIRSFLTRLKYKKTQQLRCQCAILIQRRFRIHLVRMHALATKIKQWYKIRKIMRDYQHQLFYYKMARHIQRAFRGFIGRKRAKWMRKRLISAAIIQRNLRAYRVRNDRHFAIACIHRVVFRAVRQIQTAVRRVQARQRCQVKLIMENVRHQLRSEKERIVLHELLHLKKIELKHQLMTESGRLQAYFLKRKWLYRGHLMKQMYSIHQAPNVSLLNSKSLSVEPLSFITPELIQMMESYDEFADGRISFRHLITVLQHILVSSIPTRGGIVLQREMIYYLRSRFDPLQTGSVYITEFLEWFDSEDADYFFDECSSTSPSSFSLEVFQLIKYKVLHFFRRFLLQPPRQEKLLIQDMAGTFFPQYYSFHFQQKHQAKFLCCQCLQPFLLFSDYIAHFTSKISENLGFCSVTNLPANFFLKNYYQKQSHWRNQKEIEYEVRRSKVESQYINYFSRQQCFEEVVSWNDLDVTHKVMAEREEYLFDLLFPILSTAKNLKAKIIDILIHYIFLFSGSINPNHSNPSSNSLHVNHHQSEQGVSDNRFFLNDIVIHILAKSFQLPLKKEWMLNERFTSEPVQNQPITGNDTSASHNQKASISGSSAKNPLQTKPKNEKSQGLKQKKDVKVTSPSPEDLHANSKDHGKNKSIEDRLEVIKWLNRFFVLDSPFFFMQNSSIDGSYSDNAADQHQFTKKSKGVISPSDEKEGYCYDGNYTSFGEYLSSSFRTNEKAGNFQHGPNEGLGGSVNPFQNKVAMNTNIFTRNNFIYDSYQNYSTLHPTSVFFPTITRNGFYRKVTRQVCHVIVRLLLVLKRQMLSSLFSLLEFRSKYPRKISMTDDELKSKGLENLCRSKYDEDYEFYLKIIDLIRKKEKELDSIGLEKRKQKEERQKEAAKGFGWHSSLQVQLSVSLPFLKPQYEAIHPQVKDLKELSISEHEKASMSGHQSNTVNELINPLETNQQHRKNPLSDKILIYENYLSQGKLRLLKQNPLFLRYLDLRYVAPLREMEGEQRFLLAIEPLMVPLVEIAKLSNLKKEELFLLFHSIFCKFVLAQSHLNLSSTEAVFIHFSDFDVIYNELKSWLRCFKPQNVPPTMVELTNSSSFKLHEFVSFSDLMEGLLQLLISSKHNRLWYSFRCSFLKWPPHSSGTDQGEMAFLLSLRHFRRTEIMLCDSLPRKLAPPATITEDFWLELCRSQPESTISSADPTQQNKRDKTQKQELAISNKSGLNYFSSKSKYLDDGLFGMSDTEKLKSLVPEYFDLKRQHSYRFHREIKDTVATKIEKEISYNISFTQSGRKLVSREIVLVVFLHQLVGKILYLLIPPITKIQAEEEMKSRHIPEDLSRAVRKIWDKLEVQQTNDANSDLKLWENSLWKSLALVIDIILHFLDSTVVGSCDIPSFIHTMKCFQLISPKASDEVLRTLLITYSSNPNERGEIQLPLSAFVEHLLPFLRWQLQRYSAFSAHPSFFNLSSWLMRGDHLKSAQVIARRLILASFGQHMQHQLEQSLIIMNLERASMDFEKGRLGKEKIPVLIQNDKEKSIIIRSQLIAMRQVEEFAQSFIGKFYEFRIREFVRNVYYFAFFHINDFEPQNQSTRKVGEEDNYEFEIKSTTDYLKSYSTLATVVSPMGSTHNQGIDGIEGLLFAHLLYGIYLHCEQFHHHYGRYQKRMLNTEFVYLFDYIQNVEELVFLPESLAQMIHKLQHSFQRSSIRWYDSYEIYAILRSLVDVPLSIQKLQGKKFHHDSLRRPIYRSEKNILEDTIVHMRSRARQQAVLISMNLESISVPETNYRCFVLGLKDLSYLKRHVAVRKIQDTKTRNPFWSSTATSRHTSYGGVEDNGEHQQNGVDHEEDQETTLNDCHDSHRQNLLSSWCIRSDDQSLLSREDYLPLETISYYLYARGYNFQDVLHSSLQEHSFVCSLPGQCEGKFQLKMVSVRELNQVINDYIWREKSTIQVIQKRIRRTLRYSKYELERLIIEYLLVHDMSAVEQRGSEYLREILTGTSLSK